MIGWREREREKKSNRHLHTQWLAKVVKLARRGARLGRRTFNNNYDEGRTIGRTVHHIANTSLKTTLA